MLLAALTLACQIGDVSSTSTGSGESTGLRATSVNATTTGTSTSSTDDTTTSTDTGGASTSTAGESSSTGAEPLCYAWDANGECLCEEPTIEAADEALLCRCGGLLLDPSACGCPPPEQGCVCVGGSCGPCEFVGALCVCGGFLAPPGACTE